MVDPMVVTKTEWLSLRLHSEVIYNLVSNLEIKSLGVDMEASLALQLESELISMRTLILQLRGQIQADPRRNSTQGLLT